MKQYPSIPGLKDLPTVIGEPCAGFIKYDGSNLRWEWSKKRGFYKFGTRNRLFDQTDPTFGGAVQLFQDTMAKPIEERVLESGLLKKADKFFAFTEFLGPSSFAGSHVAEEPKQLRLFDVWIDRKGLVPPNELLRTFHGCEWLAERFYEGELTDEVIKQVRRDDVGAVREGAIFKGVNKKGEVWMVKVKTLSYLKKLQEVFGRDWITYGE